MARYSLRCRNGKCRARRVGSIHPDDYIVVPACAMCGQRKGWRIEGRDYNHKELCTCGQVPLYPHRKGKHKLCTHHPEGIYNQAKRAGASDDDIPLEHIGRRVEQDEECPF